MPRYDVKIVKRLWYLNIKAKSKREALEKTNLMKPDADDDISAEVLPAPKEDE